jgi:hypothetical protein
VVIDEQEEPMKSRLAIVAALVLSLAALVAPTAGAANVIGGYVTGSGYCWDSTRILATSPGMTPAANAPFSMVGGGQEVGFRAVLQRWNSSLGRWSDFVIGPLQTRFAGYTILGDELWLNRSNNTYSNGSVWFTLASATHGYFRVTYRLYWYLNGLVSGSTVAPAYGHFDNREDKYLVPGWSTYDWCRY